MVYFSADSSPFPPISLLTLRARILRTGNLQKTYRLFPSFFKCPISAFEKKPLVVAPGIPVALRYPPRIYSRNPFPPVPPVRGRQFPKGKKHVFNPSLSNHTMKALVLSFTRVFLLFFFFPRPLFPGWCGSLVRFSKATSLPPFLFFFTSPALPHKLNGFFWISPSA